MTQTAEGPEILPPDLVMEKRPGKELIIRFSGIWTIHKAPPAFSDVAPRIRKYLPIKEIVIDTKGLKKWDSLFVLFLLELKEFSRKNGIRLNLASIPPGALHLLNLAMKAKSTRKVTDEGRDVPFFERVGKAAALIARQIKGFHAFLGQVVLGFMNILSGRSRLRTGDFLLYLQNGGARALPIVSLVSFLVGLILAFVATVQLKIFGAQIFVADLVGIAMARDMGAMMVGIIMAGRTGATYAAQLGTMQVNEEIDALRTLGIRPVEFLVIPRILALSLMMVPLCIYADLLGIAGGAVVGAGFSDVTLLQYISETQRAVPLKHFFIGLGKCLIYGIIVSMVGCMKGLSCGRSAAAVGQVTTSAVVTSIVWIIVACAIITVICYVYGI